MFHLLIKEDILLHCHCPGQGWCVHSFENMLSDQSPPTSLPLKQQAAAPPYSKLDILCADLIAARPLSQGAALLAVLFCSALAQTLSLPRAALMPEQGRQRGSANPCPWLKGCVPHCSKPNARALARLGSS